MMKPTALLLLCDRNFMIMDAKCMEGGNVADLEEIKGKTFTDLIDPTKSKIINGMIDRINRDMIASRVDLLIEIGEEPIAMTFFAGRVNDRYVISGGTNLGDVISIMDAVTDASGSDLSRSLHDFKVHLLLLPNSAIPDLGVMDEMLRLNNEVVNTGRELAKRNRDLFIEREKARVTISSIRDAVVATDKQLRITLMNQTAQELTGWTFSEAKDHHIGDIVRFQDENGVLQTDIFDASFDKNELEALPQNSALFRRSGEIIPVDKSIAPITEGSGEMLGMVVVFRDITERQRIQNRLVELNDILRLINKTMRHDIMNELTSVSGALQLHRMKGEERSLDMAERSVRRCVNLIEEMRRLESGLGSGKEKKTYDIRAVVNQVLGTFDLPITVDGESMFVMADEAISSVIENLVRNAIVHGGTDKVLVAIKAVNEKCIISIMDWGKGIPDDIKPRIFEEGFSHGKGGGSGLGLYMVSKAMARYGGSVNVRDNVPTGAIFDLTFPSIRVPS